MPIYEYKCECGKEMDLFLPMPGQPTAQCSCGREAKRKFSPFNFTFGWRLSEASHLKGHRDEFVRDI